MPNNRIPYTTSVLLWNPTGAAGTSVTPNAGSWVNSAFFQITASAAANYTLAAVEINYPFVGITCSFELDVAVGAVSSEVVVARVTGRLINNNGQVRCVIYLPIPIACISSGNRVSVRLRKSDTNVTAWFVSLGLYATPMTGTITTTTVVPLVFPSAASVTLTSGSPAWANGSYGQLSANVGGVALLLAGVRFDTATLGEIDIATGAAASEVVIATIRITGATQGESYFATFMPLLDNIAAGVRLSARYRSSVATQTSDIGVLTYPKPI